MPILITRNEDNRIMNIREGSDWRQLMHDPKNKITKGMKLESLPKEIESVPKTESTKKKELQKTYEKLQAQWKAWLLRRREICAKRYGGVASDYSTIDVPPDISLQSLYSARFIEFDEKDLIVDTRPVYLIEGSKVICTSGWVCENEVLLEDDVTDFSDIELIEPLYFQLWYAKDMHTGNISVQLLVRQEDEEFSGFPGNLIKREYRHGPICQGRINIDKSITLGVF